MAKTIDFEPGRLFQAMANARRDLQPFREKRREAVRQLVGRNWSDNGTTERVPVNLLALYTQVVIRSLVAKEPRVMMSTFSRESKPAVSAMEDWCNQRIKQLYLAQSLARIALDALFSVGIGKVALTTPADATTGGYAHPAGTPFFSAVDLDDAVWDTKAKSFDEVSFVGHRYRAPLDVVKDSKLYDRARRKLEPTADSPYNLEGDERIGQLGLDDTAGGDGQELEDWVELWEIYLPRRRQVVTLSLEVEEVLRVQRWVGPPCGPYYFLAMGDVPGNSFPKAPIMDLVDLHSLVNGLYRKLMRQAERQKTILGARVEEDTKRIVDAGDGEVVRMDNPDAAKEFQYGGVNQQNLGFAIHSKDTFKEMAGNLDMLGGLSPQSKTLGQDELLAKNASGLISDMQGRTIVFTKKVLTGLAWFWWHDPFQTMRSVFRLPGKPDIAVERRVTPEQRSKVPFEDLDLDVDPYSMAPDTPQTRVQALNTVMQSVVIPLAPMLKEQGIGVDIGAYLRKLAKYLNQPDLEEIVSIQGAPQDQAGGEGGREGGPDYVSTAPAQTKRTYERVNRSEGGGDNGPTVEQLMAGGMDGESMTGAA